MTWREWLSIAGDAASALSSVLVLGALIGWYLNKHSTDSADRLELVRHLDALNMVMQRHYDLLLQWVKDENVSEEAGHLLVINGILANDRRLDAIPISGKTRKYAQHLNGIIEGFQVQLVTDIADEELSRNEVAERFRSLTAYMVLVREHLVRSRSNPIKRLSNLPANDWHVSKVAARNNERYFARQAEKALENESDRAEVDKASHE
jgi:hypothetical protein